MKREQRKEANRAQSSYRFWHQERRALRFAADEKERSGNHVGAARMRELAQEADAKIDEAKARFKEITGVEPLLF